MLIGDTSGAGRESGGGQSRSWGWGQAIEERMLGNGRDFRGSGQELGRLRPAARVLAAENGRQKGSDTGRVR